MDAAVAQLEAGIGVTKACRAQVCASNEGEPRQLAAADQSGAGSGGPRHDWRQRVVGSRCSRRRGQPGGCFLLRWLAAAEGVQQLTLVPHAHRQQAVSPCKGAEERHPSAGIEWGALHGQPEAQPAISGPSSSPAALRTGTAADSPPQVVGPPVRPSLPATHDAYSLASSWRSRPALNTAPPAPSIELI